MRSRDWVELAGLALGAAVEGVWTGAAAAALTSSSGLPAIGFAIAVVLAATLVAARLNHDAMSEGAARALVIALALVAAAALCAAGGLGEITSIWIPMRDVVFCSLLVFLGVLIGRAPQEPLESARRAVRGFALLCGILVMCGLVDTVPPWATMAVILSLVCGGLLVATVRYLVLTGSVRASDRLPAAPWLLGIAGGLLCVVAVGALLAQVFRVGEILWVLDLLAGMARYALAWLGYAIGHAGAWLLRGLAWLLGLAGVHSMEAPDQPEASTMPTVLPTAGAHGSSGTVGSIVAILAAAVVVGLALALLAVVSRRIRGRAPEEVEEEREQLSSLTTVAGDFTARVGRRLRRLVPRRSPARTPSELVRHRYGELERQLARAGHSRAAGRTVRDHLARVAAAFAAERAGALAPSLAGSTPPPAEPVSLAGASLASPPDTVASDMAELYEVARYSPHALSDADARRFEGLVRAFVAERQIAPQNSR